MSFAKRIALHEDLRAQGQVISAQIDEVSARWDSTRCMSDSLHMQRGLIKSNPDTKPGDLSRNDAEIARNNALYHTQLAYIATLRAAWHDVYARIDENLATNWHED